LTADVSVLDPVLGDRDPTQEAKHPLEIDGFEDPAVKVDGKFGSIRFEKGRRNGEDWDAPVHSFDGGRNAVDLGFVFPDGSSRFTAIHDRHSTHVMRSM
jgi:hypothetical protein